MALIDEIAKGGTQSANPLMQFLRGRQFQQQSAQSKQQLAVSKQTVELRRKQEERAQQKAEIELIAPFLSEIKALSTPEEQEAQFAKAKEFLTGKVDLTNVSETWKEFDATGAPSAILKMAGIKPPKGTRRNILIPGIDGIQPGIENAQGQILSPTTGKRIPGATIAPSRQETGGPGSLTRSQVGKEKLTFDERSEGLRNSVQAVDEIMDFVSSDDFIGGLTGDIISTANSLVQQIAQVTGRASIIDPETGKIDENVFGKDFSKKNRTRFRRAAQLNDRVDSAVLELAFIFARELNPDGRISDADVRQAERIIRKGADKESNILTMRDMQHRMIRRFNNFAKVKKKPGITLEDITGRTKPTTEQPTQVGRFTIEFVQ